MPFTIGSVVGKLVLDDSRFSKNINKAQNQVSGFAKDTTAASKSTFGFGRSLAGSAASALGFGVAVGGVHAALQLVGSTIRDSVRVAASFDEEMVKIITLVGVAEDQVQEWKKSVRELAVATGVGPVELAKALFVVTSAGERGANALDILERSAKASAVGLGDTATIARAVTAVMQAYSAQGLTAAEATDILIATVREGNLEAAELTGSLGRVVGIAAQTGTSFSELGAFIATFTRLGVSAEEAATAFRGTLTTILKPSEEARDALELVGLSIEDLRKSIKEKGTTQTLLDLVAAFKGQDDQLAKVIPNVRALAGVLGTAGVQGQQFKAISESTANAMGLLDKATARTAETAAQKSREVSAAWETTKEKLGTISIEIGAGLLSAFRSFADFMRNDVSMAIQSVGLALGSLADKRVVELQLEKQFANLPQVVSASTTEFTRWNDAQSVSARAQAALTEELRMAEDAFRKQKEAQAKAREEAEKHREKIAALAESLGTVGLRKEMNEINEAILVLNASGERLSREALDSIFKKIKDLKIEGEELTGKFAELDRVTRQFTQSALELFSKSGPLNIPPDFKTDLDDLRFKFDDIANNKIPGMGKEGRVVIGGIKQSTIDWNEATREVADLLSETRGIFTLLGIAADSTLGKIINGISKAFDLFNGFLKIATSVLGLFSGGGGGGGFLGGLFGGGGKSLAPGAAGAGVGGALGGIGGAIGGGLGSVGGLLASLPIPLIGAGVAAFFGLKAIFGKKASAETTAEALGINFDAISKDLQKGLENIGKQIGDFATAIQLNLDQVFAQGGLGDNFDALAEKIGDTFSFLERGQISSSQAQDILNKTVAQLLPNIDKLGVEGVFQLERILAAADRLGISFDGINELAAAYVERARELGIAINDVVLNSLGLGDVLGNLPTPAEVEVGAGTTGTEGVGRTLTGGTTEIVVEPKFEINISGNLIGTREDLLRRDLSALFGGMFKDNVGDIKGAVLDELRRAGIGD